MQNLVLEYGSGEISASLKRGKRVLVRDVSFSVAEGETLAIIGETGSGKTMIALSIMGLLPRNVEMKGGSVRLCGRELTDTKSLQALLGVEIVYIPQNGHEFLNPSRRVRHHLYDNLKKLNVLRSELNNRAEEKLRIAGFDNPGEVMDKYPFQLSGGMAQRVTIAISACSRARLVIADEPTNGLSYSDRAGFIALIRELFPSAARIVITHDITVAAHSDRVVVLCGGRMMEQGRSEAVLINPNAPYTQALISSLVQNGMKETPILRGGDAECPFFRRCEYGGSCGGALVHHIGQGSEWWCGREQ